MQRETKICVLSRRRLLYQIWTLTVFSALLEQLSASSRQSWRYAAHLSGVLFEPLNAIDCRQVVKPRNIISAILTLFSCHTFNTSGLLTVFMLQEIWLWSRVKERTIYLICTYTFLVQLFFSHSSTTPQDFLQVCLWFKLDIWEIYPRRDMSSKCHSFC